MKSEPPVHLVAWALLGILVTSSALAVLVSRASGVLAVCVALGGVVAAMLLGWAAQPGAGAGETPGEMSAEGPPDQRRKAA